LEDLALGCDIHDYVEIRDEHGNWQLLAEPVTRGAGTPDAYLDFVGDAFEYPYYRPEAPESDWNRPRTCHPFRSRDYDLFSVLADVRNYDSLPHLEGAPRGVPADVSPLGAQALDLYGADGHSHTWATLRELEAFDWDQTVTQGGILDIDEFKKVVEGGRPQSWCRGIGGPGIVVVDAEVGRAVLEKGPAEGLKALRDATATGRLPRWQTDWVEAYDRDPAEVRVHVDGTWRVPLRLTISPRWFEKTLPRLREICDERCGGDPDRTRVICFFDN
jgi:hypothetical protein